jgi:hypothetical protein
MAHRHLGWDELQETDGELGPGAVGMGDHAGHSSVGHHQTRIPSDLPKSDESDGTGMASEVEAPKIRESS